MRTRIHVCLLFSLAALPQAVSIAANSPNFAREPVVVEYDVDPTWPLRPEHVSPEGWVSGMANVFPREGGGQFIEQYREDGYMILESVIPDEHLKLLRDLCQYFIDEMDARMDREGTDVIGITHRGKRYFASQCYQRKPELFRRFQEGQFR